MSSPKEEKSKEEEIHNCYNYDHMMWKKVKRSGIILIGKAIACL